MHRTNFNIPYFYIFIFPLVSIQCLNALNMVVLYINFVVVVVVGVIVFFFLSFIFLLVGSLNLLFHQCIFLGFDGAAQCTAFLINCGITRIFAICLT